MNLSGRSYKQYLAVAPFPSSSHSPEIGVKAPRPSKACVQIWSLSPSQNDDGMDVEDEEYDDNGEMKCEMVLCLDGGPAYELKWCPLPSHDLVSPWDVIGVILDIPHEALVSLLTRISQINLAFWLGHLRMAQFRSIPYPTRWMSLHLVILHQGRYMVRP